MNAKDLIQLFEYSKVFNKPEKAKRKSKKQDYNELSELDLTLLLQHRLQENKKIADFLKDYEKANKKDEPKKEGLSVAQIALWLWLVFPIIAPLYVAYIKSILH